MVTDQMYDQFWRDGYIIIRNVFEPAEVEKWRNAALRRENKRGDLLSDSFLSTYLLDDRLLNIIKSLMRSEVVYFQDSSVSTGRILGGFHKDNPDKNDPNGPDWRPGRYNILRCGLYTQNHRGLPDGVCLRKGSHEVCSDDVGEFVYGDTMVGDLAVWTMRTSHAGLGMSVFGKPVPLDVKSRWAGLLRRIPGLLDQPKGDRVALFAAFGEPGPNLDRYIAYLRTRQYAVDGWKASPLDPALVALAESKGITVRNMHDEIIANPPADVRPEHRDLAY